MLMDVYHGTRLALSRAKAWAVPYGRRVLRFLALPRYYFFQVPWAICPASPLRVASDLGHLFFRLKCYPEGYAKCRLWAVDRSRWPLYYASLTDPYQRRQLVKVVQPPEYRVAFADKELCQHLCHGLGLPLPSFLGCVAPEEDFRAIIRASLRQAAHGAVIAKPVRGTAGRGVQVILLEQGEPVVLAGGQRLPLARMALEERSILQEVVIQHPDLAAFHPESVNTVRVQTLLTRDGEVLILGSLVRFGRSGSRVDNMGAGGIGLGVHPEDGRLHSNGWDYRGHRYDRHPETGVVFAGARIPFWDEVLDLVRSAQAQFGFYRLLGFDVALTPAGPVLIEINPQPDNVSLEASCGPILARPGALQAFARYGLLVNGPAKALAAGERDAEARSQGLLAS